ncbi:trypsin-like serine protease [Streptomyces aculeolatus]|uniref:S1 family peptidase n=1 Tax=Streptomyces aculeolatus TaxID=270689 RepID=UPI001CEC3930|nr:S1 family peptidase [Streptomyces aculeolatus]
MPVSPLRTAAVLVALGTTAHLLTTAAPAPALAGPAETDSSYEFAVRLDLGAGQRACSGALVDAEWVLTAASCFADDPSADPTAPAGRPPLDTTATVGRTDLTTAAGQVRDVVELVPHHDRDLLLARLVRPVDAVVPVALGDAVPAVGEQLIGAGYGRTADEWAPLTLHTGTFTVDAVGTGEMNVVGQDGAAVCRGDAGGPVLRESAGQLELVGVHSRTWEAGCFGTDVGDGETDPVAGALDTRVDDVPEWVTTTVGTPRPSDFDCDGAEDVAATDPRATVGGDPGAGLLRVVYGGDRAPAVLQQDLSQVPGSAQPEDGFGEELAVLDHNEDGCTDLVVGTPLDDTGAADAGSVTILYGSPDGLGEGEEALYLHQGNGPGVVGSATADPDDQMGQAIAAGHTDTGVPYLLIGVPNEDVNGATNAGQVFYLRGSSTRRLHQDQPGVTGSAENGDRFGASVAGSPHHLAVGAPFEGVQDASAAGMVWLFDHTMNEDNIPAPLDSLNENTDGGGAAAESGDRYGASLAMAAYRSAGEDGTWESVLAVGVPREDLTVDGTAAVDAGRVAAFRVNAAGAAGPLANIHQQGAGVDDTAESDDLFGTDVSVVNTALRTVSSDTTVLLAVGAPGESTGGATGAGAVQTFGLPTASGDAAFWIEAGNGSGLPGSPSAGAGVGRHLHATGTRLYVGIPDGPAPHGALYALPWGNATGGHAGETGAVTTYEPGLNGLPASGVAFGWAAR